MTEDSEERRPARVRRGFQRGAYLLPSVFTIGNLALGFYAIILGLQEQYSNAVLLIFLAAFVDSIDGRLARRLQMESDFGREYDSLADLVTFGVAPALLAHLWGLHQLERAGWLFPLFYVVCATTRLARFNVHSGSLDRRFFVGLPVPAAAGALGSVLYFAHQTGIDQPWMQVVLLTALAVLGLLMVSGFRYYSFKELDPRRRWTYRIALPIAAIGLIAVLHPAGFFLVVAGTYTLFGPTHWLRSQLRRTANLESEKATP